MELYLNTIALSHGLNGVESASQYYFGKHVSDLTLAESACIASITNNPSLYAPDSQPENNKKRQTLVLDKMLELGYITQEEHDEALAEDVYANLVCTNQEESTGVANHNYFVEAMIDQLAVDLQEELGYTSAQAYKMIYKTEQGRLAIDRVKMKMPLFGKLTVKTACAQFARTMSTLLSSGISTIDALETVSKIVNNIHYTNALLKAREEVMKGIPLSEPLTASKIFPPMVCHMTGIGEETGNIEDMLEKLAD